MKVLKNHKAQAQNLLEFPRIHTHSFDIVPNKSPDNTTMQQDLPLGTQIFTANTFRSIFKIVNVSHSQLKSSKQTEQEVSL